MTHDQADDLIKTLFGIELMLFAILGVLFFIFLVISRRD